MAQPVLLHFSTAMVLLAVPLSTPVIRHMAGRVACGSMVGLHGIYGHLSSHGRMAHASIPLYV